jgi:amino acid adenylation domain-containing protein
VAGGLLYENVDGWAGNTPDAVAIATREGQHLTYRQLSRRSNQVARQLIEVGVRPGDRVAVCMAKGADAIAAMLGVNKAGAAYVPVDPESPAARVGLVLTAAAPQVILADADAGELVAAVVHEQTIVVGTLGDDAMDGPLQPSFAAGEIDAQDGSAVTPPPIGTGDLAHILFTSGSTGTPKGVMITHANVTACVDWAVDHFGYRQDDRISGHSPLHFDLSTFDIYTAFAAGATLYPVPATVNVNPADTAEWIRGCGLTQWFSVPSALNLLVRFDVIEPQDFPSLRRLVWCGEVLPTPTLIALMERLPHAEFTNLYGPTEATIASSWYRVPSIPTDPTEPVPIGLPCAGERLVVLDGEGREVDPDVIGDLYIGGVGLSPGYWQDAAKTNAVFRTDLSPGEAPSERLYKTGDLAKRSASGEYLFVGRTDSQIKSRGHRIELGEIETALQTVSALDDSAIVAVDAGGFDGATICAAFVAPPDIKPAALSKELATLIPKYMLPQRWHRFDALPTNVNGKVDRPKLRSIFEEQLAGRRS